MKQLEITNEQFHEKTTEERTTLIAYDTLFLLNTNIAYQARSGVYGNLRFSDSAKDKNDRIDLKEKLKNIKKCTMCAKGFALISKVRLNGPLYMPSYDPEFIMLDEDLNIKPNLVPDYISEDTYDMMETLFENATLIDGTSYRDINVSLMLNKWRKHLKASGYLCPSVLSSAKFRLSEISKNLILNQGIIDLSNHPAQPSTVDWDGNKFVWTHLQTINLFNN